MTILDREQMLATIPALFTGDERQVLEDWVKLAPTYETSPSYKAMIDELIASKDPTQQAAGYIMKHHATKLVFEGIAEARKAGLSDEAIILGILRWAFGNIHSCMKQFRVPPNRRLDMAAKIGEESAEHIARLVVMGF